MLDGETLAERAWRLLGDACEERLAVGKRADALPLPFPLVDDGTDERHPGAGIVAGLRAARGEVAVFVPVDCPLLTPAAVRALGEACREACVPATGDPLPAAYRRTALPVLERGIAAGGSLRDALAELDTAEVELDPRLLANVNTPDDLRELSGRA
jgi:molybdopterin-guanine dinucleotide biosynthesis protein A